MKKKSTKYKLIIGMALAIFFFLLIKSFSIISHKKENNRKIEKLPNFSLTTIYGKSIKNEDLQCSFPLVLVFFNSECLYCEKEILSIYKDLKEFGNVSFFLISGEPIPEILKFKEKLSLKDKDNLIIAQDKNNTLYNRFQLKGVPSTLIYDENLKLLKVYHGQVSSEALLKAFKN